jgi:hypothetical protein
VLEALQLGRLRGAEHTDPGGTRAGRGRDFTVYRVDARLLINYRRIGLGPADD